MFDQVVKVDFGSVKAVSFDTIMINLENLSLSRTLLLKKPVEVFHKYGNPTWIYAPKEALESIMSMSQASNLWKLELEWVSSRTNVINYQNQWFVNPKV